MRSRSDTADANVLTTGFDNGETGNTTWICTILGLDGDKKSKEDFGCGTS